MCELNMDELYTKDSKGRFEYIDRWIDLCEEDGSPAKIRLVKQSYDSIFEEKCDETCIAYKTHVD
jgi:hypothetical protein